MSWLENQGGTPRIVMITSDGLEHHNVANRILDEFDLSAIVVDRGRSQNRVDRIRHLKRKYSAREILSRGLLRFSSTAFRDHATRNRELGEVLGSRAQSFVQPDLIRYVDGINTDAGRATIEATDPDILLIYGTGIVGQSVLGMASHGAMNLHTGMSPEYRGADCAFWPVFNKEPQFLGATIHECTARIDGGDIYECAPAHIRDGDGRFAVFGRCVEVGAGLFVTALRGAVDGSLTGQKQDPDVGREYRAADMRLRHDLVGRWLFWRGIASDRAQASRVSGSIR
jgi:methionyl-tRNA formyltransferase